MMLKSLNGDPTISRGGVRYARFFASRHGGLLCSDHAQPAHEIPDSPCWCGLLDPNWHNRHSPVYRVFYFSANLARLFRVRSKNQYHDPGAVDGFDDGLAPFRARGNVTCGNPATNP